MRQPLSLYSTFILTATLVLAACASAQVAAPEPAAAPSDALPGHLAESKRSSTFEVTAIDAPTRMITLREEGEEPQTYSVNKEVRNLDQVKVGDRVKVDAYQSTSIKVLAPGELVNEDTAIIARSQPGEKPGGVAAKTRTRTEEVSSVFPETKEFLTRSEKGRLTTWKVGDAKELENLHSGDRVQFTSVSTLAVSVTPAPPKPATAAAPAPAPPAAPAPAKP